jgi:hypothetical protein
MQKNCIICVVGNTLEPCADFTVNDLLANDWELAAPQKGTR